MSWVGIGTGVALLGFAIWSMRPPVPPVQLPPVEPISTPPSSAPEPVIDEEYLKDKLFITEERAAYQSGQMVLKIPRMGVDKAVQSGTTEAAMALGPCLYDYAQLPGEGNRNVSLVAHRDIAGAEFYFAHKMGPGDLFYLVYNNRIYTYEYETTYIVTPDDWGPIYLQGHSCLTLTTCNPLGSVRERLIVRAKLVSTQPYEKNFSYEPCVEGVTKPKVWEKAAKAWDDTGAASESTSGSVAEGAGSAGPESTTGGVASSGSVHSASEASASSTEN